MTHTRAISIKLCRLSEQLTVGTLRGRLDTQAALSSWSMTRADHSEPGACERLPLMIRVTRRAGGTVRAHSILGRRIDARGDPQQRFFRATQGLSSRESRIAQSYCWLDTGTGCSCRLKAIKVGSRRRN